MAQFLKFQFFLDTFPLGFRSRLRLGSLNISLRMYRLRGQNAAGFTNLEGNLLGYLMYLYLKSFDQLVD